MKRIPLSKAKDDLSAVVREAQHEEILITRHGRPAAVIVGFEDDDDWIEYRLLNDEGFLASIEQARADIRAGHFVRFESLDGTTPSSDEPEVVEMPPASASGSST
jgi:prevent-host-death family protein